MSSGDDPRLVQPFPRPGLALQEAFERLEKLGREVALNIEPDTDLAAIPRPWDPATVTDTDMRMQLWTWLAQVVDWINAEYAWDVHDTIPTCWPRHPHLVHELAVLADQRRVAGLACSSGPLQRWHQQSLPAFRARMHEQIQQHCDEGHAAWPARARHQRSTSVEAWQERNEHLLADVSGPCEGPEPAGL